MNGLLYSNHSCDPALEVFVIEPDAAGQYPSSLPEQADAPAVDGGEYGVCLELRVRKDRNLKIGDDMDWFYPSTEYHSPRPFECRCGAPEGICIGMQRGGKFLSNEVLSRYHISPHIFYLREQEKLQSGRQETGML